MGRTSRHEQRDAYPTTKATSETAPSCMHRPMGAAPAPWPGCRLTTSVRPTARPSAAPFSAWHSTLESSRSCCSRAAKWLAACILRPPAWPVAEITRKKAELSLQVAATQQELLAGTTWIRGGEQG